MKPQRWWEKWSDMNKTYAADIMMAVLLGFVTFGCNRHPVKTTQGQAGSGSVLDQVRSRTGVGLPKSNALITSGREPHSEVDMWLFKLNGTNTAQYPGPMDKLYAGAQAVSRAQFFESVGKISIKEPTAYYFGIWDWKGIQIHSSLVTTKAGGSYLMIERYNVPLQASKSQAPNK